MAEKTKAKMPFAVWTVGETEYKLKLSIGEIERLERVLSLGNIMNPLMMIERNGLPPISYIIDLFHAGLQKFHHGYSRSDTAELVNEYLDNGGNLMGLIPIAMDLFKASGFLPK